MASTLCFQMTTMTIHESLFQVLTSIVKKYQMDDDCTITNPAQRKESWIQITNDYIRETGDSISSKQLQKRWHNQRQKQRREARLEGGDSQPQSANSNGVSRRSLAKRIKSEHDGDGNDPLENFETQWESDSNYHMDQSGEGQNQSVYDQDDESYRVKELHEIKLKILMAQAAEAEIKCEEAQYRKEEAKFKRDLAKLQFMYAKSNPPSSFDFTNSSKSDNSNNIADGAATNSSTGSESAQK